MDKFIEALNSNYDSINLGLLWVAKTDEGRRLIKAVRDRKREGKDTTKEIGDIWARPKEFDII